MRINDELSRAIIVHAATMDWVSSPAAGVDRRMLFRIGGEIARATSIIRYAPGSAFPRHSHSGGEEILVLDGIFQDEHGEYPAGSYIRNPPGTAHMPASSKGCTLFVRLWQFREGDRAQTVRQPGEGRSVGPRRGAVAATVLFDDGHETVCLEDWAVGETVAVGNQRGLEFLVLSGGLAVGSETLGAQSWGRLPAGTNLNATVGLRGAKIWIKESPLLHPDVCQLPGQFGEQVTASPNRRCLRAAAR